MVLVNNALRRAVARSLSAHAPLLQQQIPQQLPPRLLALQTRRFSHANIPSDAPDPKDILRPDIVAKPQLPLDQELPGCVP